MNTAQEEELAVAKLITDTQNARVEVRGAAEDQLRQYEEQSRFVLTLANVAVGKGKFPRDIRVFAAIHLKNVIGRQWKKFAERQLLQDLLLANIDEPKQIISVQLNLAISKMARVSWPKEWPNLFEVLTKRITMEPDHSGTLLTSRKALHTMLALLKELNTKRLPMAMKQFQMLAKEMIGGVYDIWKAQIPFLFTALSATSSPQVQFNGMERCEILMVCSKILHILLIYGWTEMELDQSNFLFKFCGEVSENNMIDRLVELHRAAQEWPWVLQPPRYQNENIGKDGEELPDVLSLPSSLIKASRTMLRTIVEIQEKKPIGFLPYVGVFLERIYTWSVFFMMNRETVLNPQTGSHDQYDRKLAIRSVTFLHNVADCREYRDAGQVHDHKIMTSQGDVPIASGEQMVSQARQVVQGFFHNQERMFHLIKTMIDNALVLTPADADSILSEGECFLLREESLNPGIDFRPACEQLLTTLVDRFEDLVVPIIVGLLNECESLPQPSETVDKEDPNTGLPVISRLVGLRESMYVALGLCGYWLHNKIPFRSFFEQRLFPILTINKGTFEHDVILKRRVLWALGCFVSELGQDLQGPLFEILLRLMDDRASSHIVVRIEAAKTLSGMINSYDFQLQTFLPFQTRSLTALLCLSGDCSESESRLGFMQTIVAIVRRVEGNIIHSLQEILQPMDKLWATANDDGTWSLWQMASLDMFEKLIEVIGESPAIEKSLKYDSIYRLQQIMVPLIMTCTERNNPNFIYLAEPATRLWAVIAKSTCKYDLPLHHLLQRLPVVMFGNETELFPFILDILEAHLMFDVHDVLKDYGDSIVAPLFQSYILTEKIKVKDETRLLRLFELVIRSKNLIILKAFAQLLLGMAQFSTGGARRNDKALYVQYLTILARTLFEFGTNSFVSIFPNPSQSMVSLIDAWIDGFEMIGSTPMSCWRRKLWVLVLCSQIPDTLAGNGDLLKDKLRLILTIWSTAFSEVGPEKKSMEAKNRILETTYGGESHENNFFQNKRQLFLTDQVVSMDLKTVLAQSLSRCNINPPEVLLNNTDNDDVGVVLRQVQQVAL